VTVTREDWRGQLGIGDPAARLLLKGVAGKSKAGGASSIPVFDVSQDERWYLKAPNNPQGAARLVAAEYIVSAVGRLIGAPVCEVCPMEIPDEFAGISFPTNLTLVPGIGSASRTIPDAIQNSQLLFRDRDDNRRRHVGVFALFDWCWGDDPQWLNCTTDDERLYSHDHGYYFPPSGGDWTQAELLARIDEAHPLAQPDDDLDLAEIVRIGNALDAVTRPSLSAILSSVPQEWDIPADDLEVLGYFLERRAPDVAARMRALHARLSSI
jgi:hypothetical protein